MAATGFIYVWQKLYPVLDFRSLVHSYRLVKGSMVNTTIISGLIRRLPCVFTLECITSLNMSNKLYFFIEKYNILHEAAFNYTIT